jgi:vacuolar protein sorting-associated protein IST1
MIRLSKTRDCPNDIKEAISSLIFASARCGDIPELFVIRKLFGKRYGEKFATTAVELFPGNLVNKQVLFNFSSFTVVLSSTENFR